MSKWTMRVVLGGVRGSTSLSHPEFMRFGGSTSCVLVEDASGARVLVDGGSGLRGLHPLLSEARTGSSVLMLFTHFHLDHLIGLPAFSPLYDPGWAVVFASPCCGGVTAKEALRRLMDEPFWPASFRARQRHVNLPDACDKPLRHGPFEVRWCPVRHRRNCYAYRIEQRATGAAVVVATDLDWRASDSKARDALIRLCAEPRPARALIMEGYATSSPYAAWGHTVWTDSVQVARQAGVGQLVLTHHAPDENDRALRRREGELRAALPRARMGYEGMKIEWSQAEASA